ncbi:hypothetical protein BJ170DRAFT_636130 [Xylariales sp. AK1849]|nr:hypothetical protein BJ170DRAFT_636130 [Xylariales sp. AK1849]
MILTVVHPEPSRNPVRSVQRSPFPIILLSDLQFSRSRKSTPELAATMKRKSDDTPTIVANGEVSGSKKRQRLSDKETSARTSKKDRRSKKDHKSKIKEEPSALPEMEDNVGTNLDGVEEAIDMPETTAAKTKASTEENPSKKKKQRGKKAKHEDTSATNGEADPEAEDETANKPKKVRFVVFVGNLPYSATVPDIEKHFSAVQPTAVRLLHEKANPKKSRGVAFVEFSGFDYMKTCLKTLHHSTFTCQGRDHRGQPKVEERKINVELTAGGGGNTDFRKEKIKAKNEKLQGERQRRAVEEEKQKLKKEQERLIKGGEQKSGEDGIHPSRRAQVPVSSK